MQHPLIIGHSRSLCLQPENTIPAFERALYSGADAWNSMVRLARDGIPVVIHDADLNELLPH